MHDPPQYDAASPERRKQCTTGGGIRWSLQRREVFLSKYARQPEGFSSHFGYTGLHSGGDAKYLRDKVRDDVVPLALK